MAIPVQKFNKTIRQSGPLPTGWRPVYAGEEGNWTRSEKTNMNKWATLAIQPGSIFIAAGILEQVEDMEMTGIMAKTKRVIGKGTEDIHEVINFAKNLNVNDKISEVIKKWLRKVLTIKCENQLEINNFTSRNKIVNHELKDTFGILEFPYIITLLD